MSKVSRMSVAAGAGAVVYWIGHLWWPLSDYASSYGERVPHPQLHFMPGLMLVLLAALAVGAGRVVASRGTRTSRAVGRGFPTAIGLAGVGMMVETWGALLDSWGDNAVHSVGLALTGGGLVLSLAAVISLLGYVLWTGVLPRVAVLLLVAGLPSIAMAGRTVTPVAVVSTLALAGSAGWLARAVHVSADDRSETTAATRHLVAAY
jgi:hypothetical protein